GSAGIQIAKLFNARVIAVAGSRWKLDKARALGADEVIDHREQDVLEEVRRLTGKRGVDLVFDHVGAATWQTSIKALARGGRMVKHNIEPQGNRNREVLKQGTLAYPP